MLGAHSTLLTGHVDDFAGARWYQRNGGPVLKPTLRWEGKCIEAPTIQAVSGGNVMFYAGDYNNHPQQIGAAFSTNGLHWDRLSSKPFLPVGKPGSWNSSESGHPGIFWDPTTRKTWLFYQGNNDMGKTWWISTREILWTGRTPRLG